MKKLFITAMCTFALVGCKPEHRDITEDYKFPNGLSDCKAYWLKDATGSSMTVIRCPNSSVTTNYKQGKYDKTVTVVEDEQS